MPETFRQAVLTWWSNARQARDGLVFRNTRDPWRILVVETMLAQTQLERVGPSYARFVERFPDAATCADATLGEVLQLWSGLGYNRRARLLHESAHVIVERHGGRVPETLDELLALPGVGPYTARAVLSSAFGVRAGVLDTNVGRVLARAVAGRTLTRSEAQALADELAPESGVREWNLALMDLGGLVCRARSPRCAECPVQDAGRCRWSASREFGAPDPAPGSAGVTTRQGRFEGSTRQGRGRLIRRACEGPVPDAELATAAGWPEDPDRARAVAEALVGEGLLQRTRSGYALP